MQQYQFSFLTKRRGKSCYDVSPAVLGVRILWVNVLGSEGLVMHEEKVNITDVVDEEGLVSGWHHVAGLLVGSKTNLSISSALVLCVVGPEVHGHPRFRSSLMSNPSPP